MEFVRMAPNLLITRERNLLHAEAAHGAGGKENVLEMHGGRTQAHSANHALQLSLIGVEHRPPQLRPSVCGQLGRKVAVTP